MSQQQLSPASLAFLDVLAEEENHALLQGVLKGIEKEGLRATPTGQLAQTPHPIGLGSALTHPNITTDFSESLLEFITSPTHSVPHLLGDLKRLHQFSYQQLGSELIWPLSMPCELPADDQIPVAQYGTSNRAKMKTVYREGLGLRYGRTMQTVAGLHYNFSLPRAFWAYLHNEMMSPLALDVFTTQRYFHLIRNFRRYYWLLIYLFGASPVVDASFVRGRQHDLDEISPNTLGRQYATALRMGNLGYQSSAQSSLFVCYNALLTYTATLSSAIQTPYPGYANLGNESTRQLNTSLLQIENEFYSPIRPKRTARANETALTALCKRGVEYLEVRCLDLDPNEPSGIAADTVRFLDTFLLYCLTLSSPECDRSEFLNTSNNQKIVVNEGRKPGLQLIDHYGNTRALKDWGHEIIEGMKPVASLLDRVHGAESRYRDALDKATAKLNSPELTPSGQMMAEIQDKLSYLSFGIAKAQHIAETLQSQPLSELHLRRFSDTSEESLALQKTEEEQPQLPFEEYLENFYQQYQSCCKEVAL